jgi:large subunit ribosomal protein L18
MNPSQARTEAREAVRRRIRRKVQGSTERPRLSVFKSGKHIYAQVIDDKTGRTVAHASSLDQDLKKSGKGGANRSTATRVGKLVAERAKAKGIARVVFDRGGYIYHGKVKALADAAREGGLEF